MVNNHEAVETAELKPVKVNVPKPFIVANTEEVSLIDVQHKHIIPVYVKDNEPLISHYDFIQEVYEVSKLYYGYEDVNEPIVRVSHPIKGRVPDARNKPAMELLEFEKTLDYERMMFIIEVPGNCEEVGGNNLTLTIGGVKGYNLDNLYNKKGSLEHFKVFVGFKNSVCTNLCVSTDGLLADLRVNSKEELRNKVHELLGNYQAMDHLEKLQNLVNYELSDKQFAQLIGRCRLYQYLSIQERHNLGIGSLQFGDQQLSSICKDYYRDESFCRSGHGSINLWKLYNLFTSANKSSYIDSFLEKSANAENFVLSLQSAMDGKEQNWFLQ